FADMPREGRVRLQVTDERFADLTYRDEIRLADAERTDAADLHLARSASISGRVTYADSGKPAVGITVIVNGSWNDEFTTDADGRYRAPRLQAGETTIS